jgi:ATP adenylyltransferase
LLAVLPFAYFSYPLSEDPTPKDLEDAYTWLHGAASSAWSEAVAERLDENRPGSSMEDKPSFSYNLALTDLAMVLCPRMLEGLKIKDSNNDLIGPISLNGTILGGTILVKSEQEWDTLRNDEEKLKDLLQAIGLPSTANGNLRKL